MSKSVPGRNGPGPGEVEVFGLRRGTCVWCTRLGREHCTVLPGRTPLPGRAGGVWPMTVDLCFVHSAWPGARPSPPRPNASARASWRCLACDGGMFTFGDGEYREVPSYDEQNWGDCVGEPAKLPSGGCRICVNPWQLLFFFFGCGTPPTSYLCREEVLEKSRIHRLGEIGRWTRSFLIRWAKGNFSYRVVHQGALSGSSGPARAVEICLARRGWRNGYSRVNSGRGVGWRPHPRDQGSHVRALRGRRGLSRYAWLDGGGGTDTLM